MIWFAALAHAACTFRAEPAELGQAIDRALASYAALDVEAFEQATTEVDYMVPCLVAPVDAALATQLHRLRGIGAYTANDLPAAEASLRAARSLAPAWVPSTELLPEGFALRELYLAQPDQIGPSAPLARPAKGAALWVDGLPARARPTDAAALIQVSQDDGVASAYLYPGEPAPSYPGARRGQARWVVSAAATALGSGVLYGLAANTADARFDASSAPALRRVQNTTNGLVIGSAGLAVAAVAQAVIASQVGPPR